MASVWLVDGWEGVDEGGGKKGLFLLLPKIPPPWDGSFGSLGMRSARLLAFVMAQDARVLLQRGSNLGVSDTLNVA